MLVLMLVFVCCSFSSSSSSAAADGFSVESFRGALASLSLVSWEIFRFRFFVGVLVLELGIFFNLV